MTPCWGVIQSRSCEWITMTVYTLQEPATFTYVDKKSCQRSLPHQCHPIYLPFSNVYLFIFSTTLSCEILDLTERRRYQRNELLKRQKTEKCKQEFIITEKGLFHPVSFLTKVNTYHNHRMVTNVFFNAIHFRV